MNTLDSTCSISWGGDISLTSTGNHNEKPADVNMFSKTVNLQE
jgi:hypothetical protein